MTAILMGEKYDYDKFKEWSYRVNKRISELEKKFKENDTMTFIFNKGTIKKMEIEITELRNKLDVWRNEANNELNELRAQRNLTQSYVSKHREELNELKEDVERCNIQDGEIATVLHLKTDNIIEVLRELINAYDEDSYNMLPLLEKLDGKKECKHFYIQDGVNPPYCKYCLDTNPPKKDSGDEIKKRMIDYGVAGEKAEFILPNSKPPDTTPYIESMKSLKKTLFSEFVDKLVKALHPTCQEEHIQSLIEEYEEKLK